MKKFIIILALIAILSQPTFQLECLREEIPGLNEDGSTPECKPIIPKCSKYAKNGDCLGCETNYYASENRKKCLFTCRFESTQTEELTDNESHNFCGLSITQCQTHTASLTSTECVQCNPSFYLHESKTQCISDCNVEQSQNKINSLAPEPVFHCQKETIENCKVYDKTDLTQQTKCLECKDTFSLIFDQRSCVADCSSEADGRIFSGESIKGGKICVVEDSKCAKYSLEGICVECIETKFLDAAEICADDCSEQPDDYTVEHNGKCIQRVENCSEYEADGVKCSRCEGIYELSSTFECIQDCEDDPNGYIVEGRYFCYKPIENCTEHNQIGDRQCQTCKTGYFRTEHDTKCTQECDWDYESLGITIFPDPKQYFNRCAPKAYAQELDDCKAVSYSFYSYPPIKYCLGCDATKSAEQLSGCVDTCSGEKQSVNFNQDQLKICVSQTIENCLYYDETGCIQCEENYLISEDTDACVQNCSTQLDFNVEGLFYGQKACVSQIDDCEEHGQLYECLKCSKTHFLSYDKEDCLQSCQQVGVYSTDYTFWNDGDNGEGGYNYCIKTDETFSYYCTKYTKISDNHFECTQCDADNDYILIAADEQVEGSIPACVEKIYDCEIQLKENECEQCISGQLIQEDSCVSSCHMGFYAYELEEGKQICYPEIDFCDEHGSLGVCLRCGSLTYLHEDGQCRFDCMDNGLKTQKSVDEQGKEICVNSQIEYCLSYILDKCQACIEQYDLSEDKTECIEKENPNDPENPNNPKVNAAKYLVSEILLVVVALFLLYA